MTEPTYEFIDAGDGFVKLIVDIPKVTMDNVELDVTSTNLALKDIHGVYSLQVALPKKIDQHAVKAKWKKKKGQLHVTMPVCEVGVKAAVQKEAAPAKKEEVIAEQAAKDSIPGMSPDIVQMAKELMAQKPEMVQMLAAMPPEQIASTVQVCSLSTARASIFIFSLTHILSYPHLCAGDAGHARGAAGADGVHDGHTAGDAHARSRQVVDGGRRNAPGDAENGGVGKGGERTSAKAIS
jgi:hypothetical protein